MGMCYPQEQKFRKPVQFMVLVQQVPTIAQKDFVQASYGVLFQFDLVSRMSQLMQNEVFDNWYNKELAQDSYKVWMNFVCYSAVLGFVILVFYFTFCRRQATQYSAYYPPNSSPLLTPTPPNGFGMGMNQGFNPFGKPNDAAGMG